MLKIVAKISLYTKFVTLTNLDYTNMTRVIDNVAENMNFTIRQTGVKNPYLVMLSWADYLICLRLLHQQ